MSKRTQPSFIGLKPASRKASTAARGSSQKRGTQCELLLRKALSRRGLRYRVNASDLPGRPDIVFRKPQVAVFCDGDFWHGRELAARVARLKTGHNASYWVAKIQSNVDRDRRNSEVLRGDGWFVLRYWESQLRANVDAIADEIARIVQSRR
jgi:DNA mismatch endonuclease (patch repair protein)